MPASPSPSTAIVTFLRPSPETERVLVPCLYSLQNLLLSECDIHLTWGLSGFLANISLLTGASKDQCIGTPDIRVC
uniref:Uncharacterized protein n=1 Tax=Papio anubis TaxID=9555 RepID=A0A8I5NCP4_PAPAN